MDAFVGFERAISRVDRLLTLHGELHGSRGRPAQHIADILRASLVLTVAALDAFVYEAVVEAVPPLARQGRLGVKADKIADATQLLTAIATPDPADAARPGHAPTSMSPPCGGHGGGSGRSAGYLCQGAAGSVRVSRRKRQ
jgi:hypothetical protein